MTSHMASPTQHEFALPIVIARLRRSTTLVVFSRFLFRRTNSIEGIIEKETFTLQKVVERCAIDSSLPTMGKR